jgi:hypothetical protein
VTDEGATDDELKLFRNAGINVIVAKVSAEDAEYGESAHASGL